MDSFSNYAVVSQNASVPSVACLISFLAILGLSASFLDSSGDEILRRIPSPRERFVVKLYRFSQFTSWFALLNAVLFVFCPDFILLLIAWTLGFATVLGIFIFLTYLLTSTWFFSTLRREEYWEKKLSLDG